MLYHNTDFLTGYLNPLILLCALTLSDLASLPQLTLTPAQQMLIQQAQAQFLAAAVQHSANQQNSTTGANISATAATPISQLPLSQPIQIASVSSNLLRVSFCKSLMYIWDHTRSPERLTWKTHSISATEGHHGIRFKIALFIRFTLLYAIKDTRQNLSHFPSHTGLIVYVIYREELFFLIS